MTLLIGYTLGRVNKAGKVLLEVCLMEDHLTRLGCSVTKSQCIVFEFGITWNIKHCIVFADNATSSIYSRAVISF